MEDALFQHGHFPTRDDDDRSSFFRWITRPQMLVALSAVLLSVCGLFISVYQTSLMRQEQRASVWPHVEVAPSLSAEGVKVIVQNTGVGPARVRAAAVTLDGLTQADWNEMIDSVSGEPYEGDYYRSLINGRVLPRDSQEELILNVSMESDASRRLAQQLRSAIIDGRLDVTLCYCSVYDECWTASMQDVMRRFQGEQPIASGVDGCGDAETSGI